MAERHFPQEAETLSFEDFQSGLLADYRLGQLSRQASLLGRKEVLGGKAKFGIFGDGKEVPQLAMARAFKKGDFRSGYYRDQTFMMAIGALTVKEFFAGLYADTAKGRDPMSGGRQMNGHFATTSLNEDGSFKALAEQFNSSADVSPTAAQMLRLVGLGYASKLFRNNPDLAQYADLSDGGDEVAFGTIGNASCAEGYFWEAVNACGVLMAPVAISIWDDEYGISVHNRHQITKSDLSALVSGFEYDEETRQGYRLYSCPGWDYPALVDMYDEAVKRIREEHIPAIFHITQVTQPQGHSTSGSHERYKSKERLAWEQEHDCLKQMRSWIIDNALASTEELDAIEAETKAEAKAAQKEAWNEFLTDIKKERNELITLIDALREDDKSLGSLAKIASSLQASLDNDRRATMRACWEALRDSHKSNSVARAGLLAWRDNAIELGKEQYSTYLYSGTALDVREVKPQFDENAPTLDGREILLRFFDIALERDPKVFIFGEDVGQIGDVNQGLAGMQEKYGQLRVSDTGIREATILGQGLGAAMRGLRPIAEIQYLDYLLYALQAMSDDLSTVLYRTKGAQKAPLIVRTRGHRLEGIWHSGSPMGVLVNALRGMYLCVPRNMTQAAGFYNTLLQADEPGLVIERLNGYRNKEKLPSNLGEYTVPLGIPEVVREGRDLTIVTYGACIEVALVAANTLAELGIEVEIIDVQTLLPFDIHGMIPEHIAQTNRVLFLDEDVPGGGTAYMMQQVLEVGGVYQYLDSPPATLSAKAHRPAYGTDGDYFSKPNSEEVFATVYAIMHEAEPGRYPDVF